VRLERIRSGDIVLVSKGGRRFHAGVRQIRSGVVELEPIERGISYRHASASEVLDVWHHRRDDAPLEIAKNQLSLAGRLDPPPQSI
jgi:hypothetical protein